jgi:AbrB family looped-hinge helix DNA binding protein
MKAILSEKGQVTIPKRIRDDLGLEPGSVLDFAAEGGRIVAHKVVAESPIHKWRGRARLPQGGTVDAYLRRIRDGR